MTRGKEASRGGSGGAGIKGGKGLSHRGSGLLGNETSLVTGQVSSQETSMGGIEGVDKGIDSSTVSAVGNQAGGQRSGGSGGLFGFELGSVGVEGEVSVGGVMGVDEGVSVGVFLDLLIIVIPDNGDNRSGSDGSGYWSGGPGLADLRVKGSGFLTGGSDMVTFNDSEAIFASDIFDSEHLAVITNVRILTDAVAFTVSLFFENGSIFGGKSGASTTVAGIEPLLFEDLGIFGINGLRQGQ